MNFNSFDLNLLRVLDALLATRSTVRAGERIGLSQPAVSAALKRLRETLDDPILLRQGGSLVPTDYAEGLQEPLRAALESIESALARQSDFDPAAFNGAITISGSDFFAEMLMPELGEIVSRRAPGMTLLLVDLTHDRDLSVLDERRADILLMPEAEYPDSVRARPMFRSDFVVAARAEHPRLRKAALRPDDVIPIDLFCALGHVVFSPEGKTAALGDAALAAVGRARRVVMTMPVFGGVCRAVARSDLIALVPEAFGRRLAPELGLALYRPPMPIAPARLDMIWHVRSDASPAHGWLREEIARILAPLCAARRAPAEDGGAHGAEVHVAEVHVAEVHVARDDHGA